MAQIIEISDLSDPAAAVYSRLTERQLRSRRDPDSAVFIAESENVIRAALKAGCEPISILCARQHISGKAAQLIKDCGVPVLTADDAVLENLTGFALTRGILCAMHRPAETDIDSVLNGASRVAVLHGLTDASNVGAIFRSAAALGYDGIVLAPPCCDPLGRKAVRVSMGSVFALPWCRAGEDWLVHIQMHGFKLAALALRDDSVSPDAPVFKQAEKLALVLGSEGSGLPQTVIDACDYTICIPMAHEIDSLNVGAAAAVAFWETRRK